MIYMTSEFLTESDTVGFDDNGQRVPIYKPTLPLEQRLLESLRGLDLDADRAEAIEEIRRAFDRAELRGLVNGIGCIMRQIKDKADAECLNWLLEGKPESLRNLGARVGLSAPGMLKRIKRLKVQLAAILQGS